MINKNAILEEKFDSVISEITTLREKSKEWFETLNTKKYSFDNSVVSVEKKEENNNYEIIMTEGFEQLKSHLKVIENKDFNEVEILKVECKSLKVEVKSLGDLVKALQVDCKQLREENGAIKDMYISL